MKTKNILLTTLALVAVGLSLPSQAVTSKFISHYITIYNKCDIPIEVSGGYLPVSFDVLTKKNQRIEFFWKKAKAGPHSSLFISTSPPKHKPQVCYKLKYFQSTKPFKYYVFCKEKKGKMLFTVEGHHATKVACVH